MQVSVATDIRSLRALLSKRNELLTTSGLTTAPFASCAKLTSKVAALQRSLKTAEEQVYTLKKELDLASAAGASGGKRDSVSGVSSSISDKKILELQEQLSNLQTELNKELRGKSNDKDQILTLRDRVAELESLLAARTKERDQTVQKEFDLAKETERQQDVISDVKAMLQHVNTELEEHKQRLAAAEKPLMRSQACMHSCARMDPVSRRGRPYSTCSMGAAACCVLLTRSSRWQTATAQVPPCYQGGELVHRTPLLPAPRALAPLTRMPVTSVRVGPTCTVSWRTLKGLPPGMRSTVRSVAYSSVRHRPARRAQRAGSVSGWSRSGA